MSHHPTVTVRRFFDQHHAELKLRLLAGKGGLDRPIREPTVNRPGLALAGFTRYFAQHRLQVFGNAETHFLESISTEERRTRYAAVLAFRVPALVFCRRFDPDDDLRAAAEARGIPILKCPLVTMKFINRATLLLEDMFAPHASEMGSMVDILGVGVLIRGESGIGKSECVLALIERGYSLVSDDITRVRVTEAREIIGTSPDLTREHMEVRGIGIINVAAMFGVKSIRTDKRVDLVVTLEPWEEVDDVDRLGMEDEHVKILGVELPHIVIPVRPGRDLARLIEVAAFQTKLKMAGHNAAKELNDRLLAQMAATSKPVPPSRSAPSRVGPADGGRPPRPGPVEPTTQPQHRRHGAHGSGPPGGRRAFTGGSSNAMRPKPG